MKPEQLKALSHFLNAHPNLPVHIQKIADELKEKPKGIIKKVVKKIKNG